METLKDLQIEEADKSRLQSEIESTIEAKVQERLDQEVSGLKSKNDELLAEKKAIQKAKEEADANALNEREKLSPNNSTTNGTKGHKHDCKEECKGNQLIVERPPQKRGIVAVSKFEKRTRSYALYRIHFLIALKLCMAQVSR